MQDTQTPKILTIVGTTRQNRFSEKVAAYISQEAAKIKEIESEVVDLRDYPLPFFDAPTSPSMFEMANYEYPDEIAKKWVQKIAEADGYVIITGEYNHGYPAVLKNAMDYAYTEWNRKAVGFASYGSALGARAVEQLRQVAVELQMAPIRPSIHVPTDIFMPALMGQGPTDPQEMFAPLRESSSGDKVQVFFDDLIWWTKALKEARDA